MCSNGFSSVAVQVAPALKPLIVKTAAEASLAGFDAWSVVPPFVQLTETVTAARLPSEKPS